MSLLDRFRPKPHPLVAWLEAQGGQAHGRKLAFNDIKYNNGTRDVRLSVRHDGMAPAELARNLECAHALLSLLEQA